MVPAPSVHRTLRETAKVDKPKPDAGEPQPAPADSGGREAADAKPFLDQIMKKAKPGLKALIGNAYRVSRQGGRVMFYLDKRHANLIPMIKSPQNYKILEDLSAEHFGRPFDIHFMIGNDPSIAQAQKRDQDALEIVKSNPVVKFVLENFNGTIVNNTILDEKKE